MNKKIIAIAMGVVMLAGGFVSECHITEKQVQAEEITKARKVENLGRGLVAIKIGSGVYLSWRYLGTDTENTSFHIYRDNVRITDTPIATKTNYVDVNGTLNSVYKVETLVDGVTTEMTKEISVNPEQYFEIPLDIPKSGVTPKGDEFEYTANDASCADLDGDGEYELILQWLPTNTGDNMPDGYRGNVYIDAYKMDGTKLWRIDRGINIRAGAHYTPFMVADFDSDGYGELVCKTADGTVDGLGNVIGKTGKDWRTDKGIIQDGPEYLTLFDGYTGAAIHTIDYEPKLKCVENWAGYWGDDFGNRSERYLGAVAYLDGKKPSVIVSRGYYKNYQVVAYDVVDKKLVKRWKFDTATKGNESFIGQGNHNLAVADVDADGYDEIVFGSCTIDHDGTGMYSSGYGHGDALHVSDFVPNRKGLEIWNCIEEAPYGAALRDAATGEEIFRFEAKGDTGRCIAGNFVPDDIHYGAEFAYVGSGLIDENGNPVKDAEGNDIPWITKWGMNSAIYWKGTLERSVLDRTMIDDYSSGRVFTGKDVMYNNGSKSNACLTADLFGDWREEMVFRTPDNSALRIYTTTIETEYRIFTLMHDTQYRCQVASQNVGYNQPPHTSFYLGTGYVLPKQPNVEAVKSSDESAEPSEPTTDPTGTSTDPTTNPTGTTTDYTEPATNPTMGPTTSGTNPTNPVVTPTIPAAESFLQNNPGLPAGTDEESPKATFATLAAQATKVTKTSNKVKWKKVKAADGYVVFGNMCNNGGKKYKFEVLQVISKNTTTSFTHKKLKKGTFYKYMVQAYKLVNGKIQIISTSKTVHSITKNGKYNNPVSVKVKKASITLKAKKKQSIKASITGKKIKKHRDLMYESSNTKVAVVTKTGVIQAKKKGNCIIYVYAQNGVCKKIKVKVK